MSSGGRLESPTSLANLVSNSCKALELMLAAPYCLESTKSPIFCATFLSISSWSASGVTSVIGYWRKKFLISISLMFDFLPRRELLTSDIW